MSKVLIVDDDDQINRLLKKALDSYKFETHTATTLGQGLKLADTEQVDLVFLDLLLPDGNGLDHLERFRDLASAPEIIIITGTRDKYGAKYALEFGVFDYLQKPLNLDEARLVCSRALEFRALRRGKQEVKLFRREEIVGKNQQLEQCLGATAKAAAGENSVLITGETGTGKDLIARAIHANSRRAERSFIVIDCASLKDSLLEDVLFGHVQGAYTGATSSQEGRVALAHKGTLFLDEIGELDLEAQKRFLRLIENKSFYPLGSKQSVKSDFRLVAATNLDLEQEVKQGHFRSDLYYRIRGQVVHLPPLRERKEDIQELTLHFVDKICKTMQLESKTVYLDFVEALRAYDWPGNIRELINILEETITAFPEDQNLQPRHLPAHLRLAIRDREAVQPERVPVVEGLFLNNLPLHNKLPNWKELREKTLDSLEKTYFQELAARTGGQVKEMARLSGLTKVRIYELLKKHQSRFEQD